MRASGREWTTTPGYKRSNDPTIAGADNYIGLSAVDGLAYDEYISHGETGKKILRFRTQWYNLNLPLREELMEWLGDSQFITGNTSKYPNNRIEKKTCSCVK